MSSGKLKIEFDNTAPGTPEAGRSILFPLGPTGDWYAKTPDGVQKQLSLPSGALQGQVVKWNGTAWVADEGTLPFSRLTQLLEDWGGNSAAGSFNWDQDTASGGSLSSTQTFPIANDKHYGRLRMRIATSSASRAGVDRGSPELSPGAGETKIVTSNWFTSDFFNPADNAEFQTGLGSNGSDVTTSNQTDGIYFRVNKDGTFDCIASDGGIHTEVNSVVNLLSERWYRFEIMMNAAGTSVDFAVYETFDNGDAPILIFGTTITTNIPPATSNIGPFSVLKHTAAGVTAAVDVWQDYFYFCVNYDYER